MRIIAFLKNYLFPKCSFSEKVNAVQKYVLRKSSSSADIFFLNNSFAKNIAVPKSNCPKGLPNLKKWLFGRSIALRLESKEKIN